MLDITSGVKLVQKLSDLYKKHLNHQHFCFLFPPTSKNYQNHAQQRYMKKQTHFEIYVTMSWRGSAFCSPSSEPIWKEDGFFLFSALPAFPWGLRGQQLEIKLPHFTLLHHIDHIAWIKSQAILFKILNVINQSNFRSSNWSSFICFSKYSLFGESFFRHSAYMAEPPTPKSCNLKK